MCERTGKSTPGLPNTPESRVKKRENSECMCRIKNIERNSTNIIDPEKNRLREEGVVLKHSS